MGAPTPEQRREYGSAERLWRAAAVTVLVPCVLATSILGFAGDGLIEAGRAESPDRHRFHRMLAAENEGDLPLVLFLGDSTFKPSYPSFVAHQLEDQVVARTYWAAGIGPYQHYALLARAVSLEPKAVVLLAHLRVMLADPPLPRPELLAEIPFRELPRAVTLPFHAQGISVGRIVLGSLAGSLLPLEAFDAAAGGVALARESPWLRGLVPMSWTLGDLSDLNAFALARFARYAAPMESDHPALTVLGASVEIATRHGARTLVIVSPVPVELLRKGGVYDERAFARRIDHLREAVAAHGGEVLDLHDALGMAQFRDGLGHYDNSGATLVGAHVLRWVRTALDLSSPPPRAGRAQGRSGS